MTKKGFVWTLEEVQRYAPNGNEWKYVIVENENTVTGLTTFYPYEQLLKDNQSNKTHAWGWWDQNEEKHCNNPLINSLYASASFKKQWKNADGEIISKDQDYLGEKLSVTFQLQVQEQSVGGNGAWTPASEYFNRNWMRRYLINWIVPVEIPSKNTGRTDLNRP